MSGTQGVTVVIAEDHALLREGLVEMLERFDFQVLGAAGDAKELIAVTELHHPQLIITDVRMPPTFHDEGLRAAIELRRRFPKLAVVVLSQYVEHSYARELLTDGEQGVGYLLKDRVADIRALVAALHDVLAGGTVIDPEVVRQLLRRRRDPLARLTQRERETLDLIARGRSNAAIARELVVTHATVAKHIRSIFDKLELPPAGDDHRRVLAVLRYLGDH